MDHDQVTIHSVLLQLGKCGERHHVLQIISDQRRLRVLILWQASTDYSPIQIWREVLDENQSTRDVDVMPGRCDTCGLGIEVTSFRACRLGRPFIAVDIGCKREYHITIAS